MKRALLIVVLLASGACTGGNRQIAALPSIEALPEAVGVPSDPAQDPCLLAGRGDVSDAISSPVAAPVRRRALYSFLAPQGIAAWACDYPMLGGWSTRVRIRMTTERADEIFSVLQARTTSVEVPGATARWQSAGSTLWLQIGARIISVEIPLLREGPTPRGAAITLARAIARKVKR